MASEMDAVLIVGGKNSANTKRLADLARKQKTPTFHIETAEEINNINMEPYNRIGISAGASTPNWIIDRVMDKVAESQTRKLKKVGGLVNLWLWAVKTDIYSAIGAGCLCLACMFLQKIEAGISYVAIASLFVYAMHVLNRLTNRKPGGFLGSFREEIYLKHEKKYLIAAFFSIIAALLLAFNNGIIPFTVLFTISLAGAIYNLKILPAGWRFQSLKDLPGSKNIFMAIAWGAVTAILPALDSNYSLSFSLVIAFAFTFGLVFIRSAISDILEIQSDKLIGRETIPVLIGKERTKKVLKTMILILLAIIFISYFGGWTSSLSLYLLLCLLYVWICFRLCDRRAGLSGAVMEGFLETSYVIAGFCVFLWYVL
jgi:4-hydroxy-3-methylbut-2-enyl diphosphate reductase